jgi:hypothetical protein
VKGLDGGAPLPRPLNADPLIGGSLNLGIGSLKTDPQPITGVSSMGAISIGGLGPLGPLTILSSVLMEIVFGFS